jgi:hypothetical protein
MTSFEKNRFSGPQMIFIGGWGTKFIFLDFFEFFGLKRSKRLAFEFKRLILNSNKKSGPITH